MKIVKKLVLINEDHAGPRHNINVQRRIPEGKGPVGLDLRPSEEDEEASVVLPEGVEPEELHLTCLDCDCVLMRGEDWDIEEDEKWTT